MFGKWRGDAARHRSTITGNTGRGPYQTSIAVVAGERRRRVTRALRYLWARTRIANLSDFGAGRPDRGHASPTITSLGLTYSLLTRYTSFIAVQEIVRRTTDGADDVDQPLPLPQGVSDQAVGVTSGAEPELVWLAAIALALLWAVHGCCARARRSGAVA